MTLQVVLPFLLCVELTCKILSFLLFERKSQNFLAVSIKKCIFAADL